jgi:TetR/AcrR family transcriptional regulator
MGTSPPSQVGPAAGTGQRILAAAVQEFAEKGFFGARMQAMADAAGVNKAMLHYYFRSKENLYRQVLQVTFQALWQNVEEILQEEAPIIQRLDRVVDLYMDLFIRNPGLVRIILREVAGGGEQLHQSIKYLKGIGITPRRSLLRVEAEMGFSQDDLLHLIVSLIGLCLFSTFAEPFLGELFDLDQARMADFSEERRGAIKVMLRVSLETLGAGSHEGVS